MTASNQFDDNQVLWAADLNTLSDAQNGTRIQDGCQITKDTGDWDTNISQGTIVINHAYNDITAQNVTHTDSSGLLTNESRVDVVTVDASDTAFVIEGNNATNPASPDVPSGNATVGAWVISNGDSTLADADRFDTPAMKRIVSTTDEIIASLGG